MRSHVAWPGLVASSVLTLAATAQCPVETEIVGLQAFAEYGSSVAMSASGHLAIVGGPSAAIDQQGLVRVYERIGERFVEHEPLAPIPAFGFSATFGRSVDLSDDGNTAVVGAPGDLDGVPGFRKGSVYVFERDSSTGVWSKTIRITQDPPTTEYSFGTRVAISGDGDTIVIAQSNDIGSEFDGLPDNVYVITRDGGWADLTPLAPAAPVDPFDQFGEAIAVSEDGATIVTRSFDHDTFAARVHVFERDGSSYSETQIIEHAVGDIFDGFGRALAVTGDTLVIGDNGIDIDVPDLGPFPNVGLVNIYTRGDGRWSFVESFYPLAEVVPDSTFGFSGYIDLGFGGSVALRGDELLVGSTSHHIDGRADRAGAAFWYRRVGGTWTFLTRVDSPAPEEFGAFTRAVDIAADGSCYVIGQPLADVEGFMNQGLAFFIDAVTTITEFEIQPPQAYFLITIEFPDMEPQVFAVNLDGSFSVRAVDDCDGTAVTTQVLSMNVGLENDRSLHFMSPTGPMMLTDLNASITEVGDSAYLEDEVGRLGEYGMQVTGAVGDGSADGFDTLVLFFIRCVLCAGGTCSHTPGACCDDLGFCTVEPHVDCDGFFRGYDTTCSDPCPPVGSPAAPRPAGPPVLTVGARSGLAFPGVFMAEVMDLGFGRLNPTMTVRGSILAFAAGDTCDADLDGSGSVDFPDLLAVLAAWSTADAAADLDGSGVVDFPDLLIVLSNWGPCE